MAQLLEILQQALQIERDGEEYYHQAAEQSSHPVHSNIKIFYVRVQGDAQGTG